MIHMCNTFVRDTSPFVDEGPIFASNLIALRGMDVGIRLIDIGKLFQRLASKVIVKHVISTVSAELKPIQLGVGVPRRLWVRGARLYVFGRVSNNSSCSTSYSRQIGRAQCVQFHSSQSNLGNVFTTNLIRLSSCIFGLRQPKRSVSSWELLLLFMRMISPIWSHHLTNVWYLDDVTLGGALHTVNQELTTSFLH